MLERISELCFYFSMVLMCIMIGALIGKITMGHFSYRKSIEYNGAIKEIKNEYKEPQKDYMRKYITVTFPEQDK